MDRRSWKFNPYIIDCNVLNEQYNFFPAGYEFFPRNVRFYEIQFITGGEGGKLIIDGRHYEPRKGDLFFRKPGMSVQGVAGFYSYNICFDPVQHESRRHCYHSNIPFWASNESTTLPDGGYFDALPLKYNSARFNELEPLFSGIIDAFSSDPQANQSRMKAAVLQIMDIIIEELDNLRANARMRAKSREHAAPSMPLEKQKTNQYHERITATRQYIDEHLGDKLSLDTLARRFGSSPSFFSRMFKKIMGITPFEYIIESRLTLARKLLITTGESVEEIASTCGFDDMSHFYRVFKRRFNMTPALLKEGYQNQARENDMETVEDTPQSDGCPAVDSIPSKPTRKDNYAGELTDGGPNPFSSYPYIIGYTYNNQPNYLFPVGVRMVPRVVRFYEIELIIGGAGKEITDGLHFNASRGDIFFRKPGMENQGISGYYFYEIAFDPRFSESRRYCYDSSIPFYLTDWRTILPGKVFFPHFPYKYHTDRFIEFEPMFAELVQLFPKRKEGQPLECRAILQKILTMMNEELITHRPVFFENPIIKNNYDKIMACKKYIDNHPNTKFSLEVLAEMSGLSRNFFCKLFKEITGNTPLEYVTETRIKLAKNLLTTSTLNIEEISSRSGFENVTYFYRIFKRNTDMTPNTFRQKFKVSHK